MAVPRTRYDGGRSAGQTGFTLLEVLVAFAITSVALGVLFQIYTRGTTSAILGEEYSEAVAIAESRLATIGVTEELEATELSGVTGGKYHWRVTIDEYRQATEQAFISPLRLMAVTVELTWQSRGQTRTFTLNTLRTVRTL